MGRLVLFSGFCLFGSVALFAWVHEMTGNTGNVLRARHPGACVALLLVSAWLAIPGFVMPLLLALMALKGALVQ